ncbi:Hypothetical predicted protein [Cloeon dipterum]|uniref:Uncharacterized protein n=2 Tax=Cloeon dipterum TaxID=197152 RepID=A0A8S1CFI6_9INSE|nr:Hypothetical predicted protein [Cloeon dipterum]
MRIPCKSRVAKTKSRYLQRLEMCDRSTSLRPRRHSFDDFISVEELNAGGITLRKCKSLCGDEVETESSQSSEGEWSDDDSTDSVKFEISTDCLKPEQRRFTAQLKDQQLVKPVKQEAYEKRGTAPDDLSSFREHHKWVPPRHLDSLLPNHVYAIPTPNYVWKMRRKKLTKKKHYDQKRFEVLEIASDIDTDDDKFEEETEKGLDALPARSTLREMNISRVEWLKSKLTPLRNRACSSDEYSDTSDPESEVPRSRSNMKTACNSSDDDFCHVDQDSDYEYSHLWGESNSDDDSNLGYGPKDVDFFVTEYLTNSPKQSRNVVAMKKCFQAYDSPSPEPFLPETQIEPVVGPICMHKLGASDSMALEMMDLGLDAHSELPRVSNNAPTFKLAEVPVDLRSEKLNIDDTSSGEES